MIRYRLLDLYLCLRRVEKEHLGNRSAVSRCTTAALPLRRQTVIRDMAIRREEKKPKQRKNRDVGTLLKFRCTAIQKFLLDQTTGSEKSIRGVFGNNPDTSKALRMLVKEHKVKRFGSGGRSDPFIYMALVPPPVSDLECLKQAKEAHGMCDSLDV